MTRRRTAVSWIERSNRRGCFAIAIVVMLLIAVLAYVGFSAGPIDNVNSVIPTLG